MSQSGFEHRQVDPVLGRESVKGISRMGSCLVVVAWLILALHPLSAQEIAVQGRHAKILERLLSPFRSNPFLQSRTSPCGLGFAHCFSSPSTMTPPADFGFELSDPDSDQPVMLELRTDHEGPFAHHWLELEGEKSGITIGFGPATLPFIDSGQVSLEDRYGNIQWISGMHPLPWLALPPIKNHYAGSPGEGRIVGNAIPLTVAQSDTLIRNMQRRKFVGPYIPMFHDCRTFACAVMSRAAGRSTLPCYLLFKGHW